MNMKKLLLTIIIACNAQTTLGSQKEAQITDWNVIEQNIRDNTVGPDTVPDNNTKGETILMLAIGHGKTELAKTLLTKNPSLEKENKGGETALHYAIVFGNLEMVKQLIAAGAKFERKNGKSRISSVVANYSGPNSIKILQFLVPRCDSVSDLKDAFEFCEQALKHSDIYLLKLKSSMPNYENSFGKKVLHYTRSCSKIIGERGKEVERSEKRTPKVNTPVTQSNSSASVEKEERKEKQTTNNSSTTSSSTNQLLSSSTRSFSSLSSSSSSASSSKPSHVWNVSWQAEPKANSQTGSAFTIEITEGSRTKTSTSHEIEIIAEDGFEVEDREPTVHKLKPEERAKLIAAIKSNAQLGLSKPFKDETSFCATPLMHAANDNDTELFSLITQSNKETVHDLDSLLRTPLFYAVASESAKITQKLIALGANVNAYDIDGETPLMLAVMAGNQDITKELIRYKANIDAQNKKGYTPLMYAIRANDPKMVECVLKYQPKLSIKNYEGLTACTFAQEALSQRIITKHSEEQSLKEITKLNTKIRDLVTKAVAALDLAQAQEKEARLKLQQKKEQNAQKEEARRMKKEDDAARYLRAQAAEEKARLEQEAKKQAWKEKKQAQEQLKKELKKKDREIKEAQEQQLEATLFAQADIFARKKKQELAIFMLKEHASRKKYSKQELANAERLYNSKLISNALHAMKTSLTNKRKEVAKKVFEAWKSLKERNIVRNDLYSQAIARSIDQDIADKKVLSKYMEKWLLAKHGRQIIARATEIKPIGSERQRQQCFK